MPLHIKVADKQRDIINQCLVQKRHTTHGFRDGPKMQYMPTTKQTHHREYLRIADDNLKMRT